MHTKCAGDTSLQERTTGIPSIDCWHLQDAVCTPDGYMFNREAILENLLQQKKAIKRKLAAWEAQQQDEQRKVGTQLSG